MEIIQAPWNLKGRGYILLYKFNQEFVQNKSFLPPFLNYSFKGGFGAIMILDYLDSDVGPYQELLFIPGKFNHKSKKYYSITKIFVSSMESVVNGRNNWGIPKQLADFKYNKDFTEISVDIEGINVLNFRADFHFLKIPVSTKLFSLPLLQRLNKKDYYTRFKGKGFAKFAKIKTIESNPELFPDINNKKRIASFKIENFNIQFPKAIIK